MPSTKHTHTHTRTHARYIYLYIAHIVYGSGTLASCSDAAQSLQLVKVFEPQLKSQLTATSTLAPNLWQLQSTEIRYAKKRLPRAKPRYAWATHAATFHISMNTPYRRYVYVSEGMFSNGATIRITNFNK